MTLDLDLDTHAQRQRDWASQDDRQRVREALEQQEQQAREDQEREAQLNGSRADDPRSEPDDAGPAHTAPSAGSGMDSQGLAQAGASARTGLRRLGLCVLLAITVSTALWFFLLRDRPQRLAGLDGSEPALQVHAEVRDARSGDASPISADLLQAQAPLAAAEVDALSGPVTPSLPAAQSEQADSATGLPQAASPSPVEPLQEQLQRIEHLVLAMRTQLAALSEAHLQALSRPASTQGTAPAAVQASVSRPAASARHATTSARRSARAATAMASTPAPPPSLGAQLLSVDLWNGEPSVIVTSGLSGDSRTRTLRPGDVINGVSLKSADPATGSATFGVNDGRSFTLSAGNGS